MRKIVSVFVCVFILQSCGENSDYFSSLDLDSLPVNAGPDSEDPGAPEKDPSKCKDAKVLSVGLDVDGDLEVDIPGGHISTYSGELSAKKNYDYYSASAHPIIGPELSGFASKYFFYEGSDGLTLYTIHNIDAGGSKDNQVKVYFDLYHNQANAKVILSDDHSELKKMESDKEELQKFVGDFHYWKNTDGGVIGPIEMGAAFKLVITPQDIGDMEKAGFYSSDNTSFNLLQNGPNDKIIIEFFDCE